MPENLNRPGELPVAVIGAGPIGLAAAAHLLEHGLEPLILEAEQSAGAAIRDWAHIRLFSPWRYNIDDAARRLLERTAWEAPRPTALPYGSEIVEDYLEPLARTPELRGRIRLGARVHRVSRESPGSGGCAPRPFLLDIEQDGQQVQLRARAVIDASGTWRTPNGLGPGGAPVPGEPEAWAEGRMLGALPDVLSADRDQAAGRRVLVVGSGHSAVNTLLNLSALKREETSTTILWAIRSASPERTYGGGERDQLPERGALGDRLRRLVDAGHVELLTSASVAALSPTSEELGVTFEDGRKIGVDRLVTATGFRPDLSMHSGTRLDLDPQVQAPSRLAPLIDPALHSCGTVPAHGADVLAHPEEGLFIAGMKSYGTAPTFLMATGYEQVRSIAAHLAGGDAAARDLNLPQTGVCSA